MTFDVVVTEPAEKDADSIFEWLEQQSPAGARKWWLAFLEGLRTLERQASIYSLAPESAAFDESIRQLIFRTSHGRPYRILYVIRQTTVFVLRVRGAAQNLMDPADIEWPE